jgi:spore maturation protein CgeB
MKLAYFTHSLASCWNHGNAHFLRGVLRELVHREHEVKTYEPSGAWSLENLLKDHGEAGLDAYRALYPELSSCIYQPDCDLDEMIADADVVIAHEWNEPWLIAAVGKMRRQGAGFKLLFHDTHHRAVSDPDAIRQFDLNGYDGVLAFGDALAKVYRSWGWGNQVHVWHEAADTRLFRPPTEERERKGLVWIGNWGDDERRAELESFLLRPAQAIGLPLDIFGVRYPDHALAMLSRYGVTYHGWLSNARVPEVFGQHLATVHVPRRFYVSMLPGIPTIRIFEALACGIPLVSSPWHDAENLFHPGKDYLVAQDEAQMERHLNDLCHDPDLRCSLIESGLAAIRSRHSCAHRVDQLLAILAMHGAGKPMEMSA